jgi:hypothetical protein
MPSVSKKQQRLFGMVRKCQKTGVCLSPNIKKMADSISPKAVRDFAKTKHKNLPHKKTRHVKEEFISFKDYVILRENLNNT